MYPFITDYMKKDDKEEWINVRLRRDIIEELNKLKVHPRQPLYEVIEALLRRDEKK
jgi:hypothetical protein